MPDIKILIWQLSKYAAVDRTDEMCLSVLINLTFLLEPTQGDTAYFELNISETAPKQSVNSYTFIYSYIFKNNRNSIRYCNYQP